MIKIIADSTCDLSEEIIDKYNIGIAPLTIHMEGKDYRDKIDISPDEFYAKIESLKTPATTAMPSPAEFLKLFEDAKADGYEEIICICMSSGTSGSYQSAMIAYQMFLETNPDMKLHVVDSRSMSHGSGWLIMKTARLLEKGWNFDQLVFFNENYKLHTKHFLSVDDLDQLIRSGRLSNVSAMIGKLLKLKPIMTMKDGKGAIVAKERGRKSVLEHYVREFDLRIDTLITDFIIIGYTSDIQYARNLELKIKQETSFSGEIYIMQMGVAVGTHVGLGGLSMFFMERDRKHDGLITNEISKLFSKNTKEEA